ncbi:MAG TPA: sugar ABC transporter permease [Herpetosiphonaceae bacterium]|nr:sugar ABC transporter permease [Herpetosiphonaceae bacterium]
MQATVQARPQAPKAGKQASRARQQALQGLLFTLPALVLLVTFLIYPTLWTIRLSFDSGRGLRLGEWVGLDNYVRLLTRDRNFLNLSRFPPSGAVINNIIWVLLMPTLCVGLGLLIAVLTDRVRYERLIKVIIFLPMAISATAVAIIWRFVYNPDANTGLLNAVLTTVIPGFEPVSWLGRASTVNVAIIIAAVWAQTGFAMTVLSAALKGISLEVLEAARTDGANERQVFFRIILPLLSLPISVVTITLVINVIKVFDIIYIMTGGGPRGASRVIAYTMFTETFQGGRAGYGAAVAVIMLLVIIPIMLLNIRRFKSEEVTR